VLGARAVDRRVDEYEEGFEEGLVAKVKKRYQSGGVVEGVGVGVGQVSHRSVRSRDAQTDGIRPGQDPEHLTSGAGCALRRTLPNNRIRFIHGKPSHLS
jgi:hypothetical protein